MRRYIIMNRRTLLQLAAAAAVGLILGAVVATVNLGHQVDQLTIEKENLTKELSSVKKELAQIEENLSKRRAQAVNSIEARVTFPEDIFSKYEGSSSQLELENKIAEMLQPLNGKEINKLDGDLVIQIVEGRRVTVKERDFRLTVQLVVISQKLTVHVEAKPIRLNENSGAF